VTETEFSTFVIDTAHLFGWKVAHFRPARTKHGWVTPVAADGKGYPDLTMVRERVIFAELKVGRNKLSEEQASWVAALASAGAEIKVWRPEDEDLIVETLRLRRPS
jgi:hypothetical protein